ncbi:extracellular solute-binding protein [Paenibacillus sp. J5C_2022]|uniref:extracellular solute-binding protein n=1 Tax=Paenibacillus sp. J5C2022 TaxID=2977129 RepID=UPI0021CE57C8|nr:extracellular solute-binding protein [Paenibacillus sp. J5C2022]MCU6712813.1 extracellular solute-binding protein [Paenibacillus sp. J5C2022]
MKGKHTTRLMVAALAMLLLFTGCAGNNNEPEAGTNEGKQAATEQPSQSGNDNPDEAKGKDYTLPIVEDGSTTLTVGAADNYYTPASYTQNLPIWKAIEERTGVKVKWDVVPAAQYKQTMTVRLASMKNIPDLLTIPGDPAKLGSDGVLEPLEELIRQYAPNIRKLFQENPDIHNLLKSPDGHIYSIPSIVTGTSLSDPGAFLIRQDWLDKLDLEQPKSIDDWYAVLKAFKEGDPNGNGKPDELPVALASPEAVYFFGDAWGLHLIYSDGWWPDSNGKVQAEWMKPEAKELVAWLSKLYKEGLLDPDYLTSQDDQLSSKITKDQVGSTRVFINRISQYDSNQQKAGVEDVSWVAVTPPTGPNGYKGHAERYGPISGAFGMSALSKHKETAIKWLDFMYASEEGNRFTTFGMEGVTYTMENGEPKFTAYTTNNPDGLNIMNALRTQGAAPTLPWIRHDSGIWSKQPPQTIVGKPKLEEAAAMLQSSIIDPIPFHYIALTPEEASSFKPLHADYTTKLKERLSQLITGAVNIDEGWDKFMKELKDLGIDELLAIRQQQYDRYMGK